MMIAIPNMEKPKDCSECILADKHLNGLYEAKYYCRLEADSCPLIEIVRCGECKHMEVDKYSGQMECTWGFEIECSDPCCGVWLVVNPNDFCPDGERRADDNTIKANK